MKNYRSLIALYKCILFYILIHLKSVNAYKHSLKAKIIYLVDNVHRNCLKGYTIERLCKPDSNKSQWN